MEEKPPWSKGRIKKLGEAIRTEDEYDKALFNDFMRQQTRLITEIEPIIQEVLSASILNSASNSFPGAVGKPLRGGCKQRAGE
ncbi:hypothetical protein [Corynebacterium pseudodiphtheriticum]|uniref:hypothetical protein n=1 Tax=Corynebacterium pseudodiphtheriticum TaxID=37637 RepID=UPI00254E5C1F|nr:hypothetical protein [Corynebacterium pseudodiphtheriticum]MDK8686214.1 hypothetical protein [Corynebacterium pseudodiphtheriticum]